MLLIVKLNDKMQKKGLGFHDVYGEQKIFSQVGHENIQVKDTSFVQAKLKTGELILVDIIKDKQKNETTPIDAAKREKAQSRLDRIKEKIGK